MQILEKPKRERAARGPRDPGWWRRLFLREGTIVDHRGEVWRMDVYVGYDGSYRTWTHLGTISEYRAERQKRYVEATMPTRGPKGRAGDSGVMQRAARAEEPRVLKMGRKPKPPPPGRYFNGGTPR